MIFIPFFITLQCVVLNFMHVDAELNTQDTNLKTSDYADHPLVHEVEDLVDNFDTLFPNPYDPTEYWTKKFLQEVIGPSDLPLKGYTFEELRDILHRIAEYDDKGYLKQVARGNISPMDLFKDASLRPLMFRSFMPIVTIEDPIIQFSLEQEIDNNIKIINQVPMPDGQVSTPPENPDGINADRKIRSVMNPFTNNKEPPFVNKGIVSEGGKEHHIKKRDIDDSNMTRWEETEYPQKNTALKVTGIKVQLDPTTGLLVIP